MISTKEQYKEALNTIVVEMKKIVALIRFGGKDVKARILFNKELYDKYNLLLHEANSPFAPIFSLYVALDEYLNSEGARTLGAASKEHILGWYSSLEEDIQKVSANIEALKD